MELHLIRIDFTAQRTIGVLLVDGVWECFTLEDAVHPGPKLDGATAIPVGRYPVVLTFSTRFQRVLPILRGVAGFTGIRIHAGNTDADTAGCILVGQRWVRDAILESRAALEALLPKLTAVEDSGGSCYLTITGAPTPA